jgi:hypothetical protein
MDEPNSVRYYSPTDARRMGRVTNIGHVHDLVNYHELALLMVNDED